MRKFYLLLTTLSGWLLPASAQVPGPAISQRLSPSAVKKITDNQASTWWVVCKDTSLLSKHLIKIGADPVSRHDARTGLTVIRASWEKIVPLVDSGVISYVDKPRIPKEEVTIPTFDASANQLNTLHHLLPSIDGRNLVLSLKERRPDTTDPDLRGRYLSTSLTDADGSAHATIMATMAAGAGNSHVTGKGAAPGTTISSASFSSLLPETDADYLRYKISVQNHSYGTGIENYYGADALAYDASVIAKPDLVHVFSAGNNGSGNPENGPYAGIPGFANLTGSFKMAKNILTVGAIDSFYNIAPLSSRGPAYDGRLKPELVAYGQDGSSGASAIVSGIALLLQHCWQMKEGSNSLPPASLVKAILINAADDLGNEGPDHASGYGNANAIKAVLTMNNKRFFTGTLQPGTSQVVHLTIGPGIRQLKASLCWTDPPAVPNSAKALVNNLDLQLVQTNTGKIIYPWVLSAAAQADSLQKPARRGIDTLNNTEQVSITDPAPGDYQLVVHSSSLHEAQAFSLAWQADTAGRFNWYAPTGSDPLRGGVPSVIRWSSSFNIPTGKLEYSTGNNQWVLIEEALSLGRNCYRWDVPDINAAVRLRITVGNDVIHSDEFIVSSRITGYTGFNCPDSFLIGWNKVAPVTKWAILSLGENDQHLHTIIPSLSDTVAIFQKGAFPQRLYAIAPLIGGKPGQQSFLFDYSMQGVDCYIKSFLASLPDPTAASIRAELGTLHQVKRIVLEKITPKGILALQVIDAPSQQGFNWKDPDLGQGENTYRLKIELGSGQLVYSQPEKVWVVKKGHYLVWPNPVSAASGVWVYDADLSEAVIQLYNVNGQLLQQQALVSYPQWLSVAGLKNGLHYLVIRQAGKRVYQIAILVR
ncbi:MAG: S8 family peptidase [Chitinophagaceae bacterium]|nr:S8 family peptidase [Chitinophagaceae bacterium]